MTDIIDSYIAPPSEAAKSGMHTNSKKKYHFDFDSVDPSNSYWINHDVIKPTVLRTMIARWNFKNETRPLKVINHTKEKRFEVAAKITVIVGNNK